MKDDELKTLILLILAIFLPPLAVILRRGVDVHFWLNIGLCLLAWLPGVLHAIWTLTIPDPREE